MLSPVSPSATGKTLSSLTRTVSLEMRDRALEQGGQTAFVTLPAFRQRVQT